MHDQKRVEWKELRATHDGRREWYWVIAEESSGQWEFYEKSAWDIRWSRIPFTSERMAKAIEECAKQFGVDTQSADAGAQSQPSVRILNEAYGLDPLRVEWLASHNPSPPVATTLLTSDARSPPS